MLEQVSALHSILICTIIYVPEFLYFYYYYDCFFLLYSDLGRVYKIVQWYSEEGESQSVLLDIFDVTPGEPIRFMEISKKVPLINIFLFLPFHRHFHGTRGDETRLKSTQLLQTLQLQLDRCPKCCSRCVRVYLTFLKVIPYYLDETYLDTTQQAKPLL